MNLPFLFAFHINPDVNCHVTVPTAAAINTLCTCAPSVLVRCLLIWSHTICQLLFLQHRKLGSNGNLQLARILKVQLNRWAIKCGVCTTTLGGDGYSLGSDLMGVFSLVWLAQGQWRVDLLVNLDGWFVILLSDFCFRVPGYRFTLAQLVCFVLVARGRDLNVTISSLNSINHVFSRAKV